MILLASLAALLAQSTPASDSLRLVREGGDPSAVRSARQDPDTVRSAITRLYALAARSASPSSGAAIAAARELALAYAVAWNDSFPMRQVGRFERWSVPERVAKARSDSLRRAGADVLARAGARAATPLWRESLNIARSIHDSAGEASSIYNLGVAFYREGAFDSASTYLGRARSLAVRVSDHRTIGNAIGTLGSIAKDHGDLTRARALYARALALRPRSGDDRGAASDENNLGLIAETSGDSASARRYYESALARNRRAGRSSIAAQNLTNLANLATRQGRYAPAAMLYREALTTYRVAGERAREGPVLHNLGLLALRQGDFPGARTTLSAASSILDETGPIEEAVEVRIDRAEAEGAMGELAWALGSLQAADSASARLGRPDLLAQVALARGDMAVSFNALHDAEKEYARATALFGEVQDSGAVATVRERLGLVQLHRDDPAAARVSFTLVAAARARSGDPRAMAIAQLLLGTALAELGETDTARVKLSAAAGTLRRIGDRAAEAAALGAMAELEREQGHAARAESLYRRAIARVLHRSAPMVADFRYGYAQALASRGRLDAAARELRLATDVTDHVASQLPFAESRSRYRADKWAPYELLALIERRRGRPAAAFDASERLRARQMLDVLAELGSAAGAWREDTASGALKGLRRVAVREPAPDHDAERYAMGIERLVYGKIALGSAVMARLRSDEALLEYLVTDSTTMVFVVRHDRIEALDLGIGHRALAASVVFTREMIATGAGPALATWDPPLRRLYRVLIEPVERQGWLRGARTLLIAPHAELHSLPFAALITGGQFLIERYDVAYVPSASVWIALADRGGTPRGQGVLALAPRPDALPASLAEVRGLGALYGPSVVVLTAQRATEAAFRERAPKAAVVHLATFGVLNRHNPLFSFLELAQQSGDDGRLNVHEVFRVPLQARLVVLSACETALGSGREADVPPSDDWIGLVRAFLYAGADNVLATLWPIDDATAAAVMRRFHEQLAQGRSFSGALAVAQRGAIRDPRARAPRDWASFALAGISR